MLEEASLPLQGDDLDSYKGEKKTDMDVDGRSHFWGDFQVPAVSFRGDKDVIAKEKNNGSGVTIATEWSKWQAMLRCISYDSWQPVEEWDGLRYGDVSLTNFGGHVPISMLEGRIDARKWPRPEPNIHSNQSGLSL